MNKRIYIIALVAAILMMGGCSEFLDERPIGQETVDSFLGDSATTADNFEQMLHAAYSVFTVSESSWRGNSHYFENMIPDWLSDDAEKGGNGASDFPEMLDMISWKALPLSTAASHYGTPWMVGYLGAGRANTILVLLEEYKENLSNAEYNRIKGECLFLRGYFYFLLARTFGSVPYFDEPVTPDQYYDQPKLSPEELYSKIEADFSDAVGLLPEKSDWTTVWPGGRATKGAARAMLARVLSMEIGFGFNDAGWQDVYTQTSAIVTSNEYALLANYAEVWADEGEMGTESVFEIPCADFGGGYGSPGGNMMVRMTTLRQDATLTYGANTPTGGWGFSTPTQELFDEFEDGDPRRECTIIADGDYFMGDEIPTIISGDCPDGYWLRKYAAPDPRQNTHGENNVRVIRYAEVLLTHAEACYHTGREGDAVAALTEVRTRAQNSSLPKGSVPGDPEGYAPNPGTLADITATSGQALLDAIKHERRVELAIEGIRYYDLVRWGEYEDALVNVIIPNDYFLGTLNPGEVRAAYQSHLIDGLVPSLPIPSDEVETYRIEQNPGY